MWLPRSETFCASQLSGEGGKIKSGSAWIVPENLHRPIRQDAVLLARAKDSKAAAQLLAFLKTGKTKAVIRSFGYEPPEGVLAHAR